MRLALDDIKISIHALLAESDAPDIMHRAVHCNFYPRSPCGERLFTHFRNKVPNRFLSTLSLRRATFDRDQQNGNRADFYPRSPCGERRKGSAVTCRLVYFYPRSPCGERRSFRANTNLLILISIHALLAESDRQKLYAQRLFSDFYPRSPCGERQY